jgi:hypothetical protein
MPSANLILGEAARLLHVNYLDRFYTIILAVGSRE